MGGLDTVFILSRHDSHAELVVKALQAGKHVFVEKPLALSHEELQSITTALDDSDRQLWVGFNRRHSESTSVAKRALGASEGPLVANYRVSAGRLPDMHWYKDRRQGGRLLGEVCHFIDLTNWIVGAAPVRVFAAGSGVGEVLLQEDVAISVQYADGSIATVTYAEHGHSTTSKERLEILGRGHSVLIDDFQKVTVDGKDAKLSSPGKGHVQNLKEFRSAIARGRRGVDLEASLLSTRCALAAVDSLTTSSSVEIKPITVT